MDCFTSIFERIEEKYLMSESQYDSFFAVMRQYTVPDSYGRSVISNIYYDTPNDSLIRASLEKPVYKEKLRLRCYETPSSDPVQAARTTAFVEIKKKFDDMVYKRRVAMTYPQAIAFLNKGIRPDTDNTVDFQILNEIEWLIKSNPGIRPKMFISYERNAYFSSDDKRVRITFDKNIQWRTVSLALSAGIFGAQLLGEGEVLAEIKLPEAMPLWMARALDINKIYPVSLSKYGRAYQLFQIQAAKAEGVTFCA